MLLVAALIGALLNRLRGGWLKDLVPWKVQVWRFTLGVGTQVSRLVWAVPTAALMTEMSHAPIWLFPILIVSVFTAQALYGTGQYLRDVPLTAPDLLGFYRNAGAAIPVFYFAPHLFAAYAIVGATHSTLYWLGHRTGYDSRAGECIVGAVSWSIIVLCR